MFVKKISAPQEKALGLAYLSGFLPENIHVISNYTGVSFANTIRMLTYDLNGGRILAVPDEAPIARYLAIQPNGEVAGVCMCISLPEYNRCLEYEDYLLVMAQTQAAFDMLLQEAQNKGRRYEVITVRTEERRFLAHYPRPQSVHHWSVFRVTAQDSASSPRPFDASNDCLSAVACNGEESNPVRYAQFAKAGVGGYAAYALHHPMGGVCFAVSILPYAARVAEIKLWWEAPAGCDSSDVLSFVRKALYLQKDRYDFAVLRVKGVSPQTQALLCEGKFELLCQEEHFHFPAM